MEFYRGSGSAQRFGEDIGYGWQEREEPPGRGIAEATNPVKSVYGCRGGSRGGRGLLWLLASGGTFGELQ